MAEETVWGIHAGKTGDAETLFLKRNVVAIGWSRVGDLSKLGPKREAFKDAVAKAIPEYKLGAVPVAAGQLFRFVFEMRPGDIVAFPSKRDRHIHLGRIESDYRFEPSEEGYPNRRAVKWVRSVPRTDFSQGALYEIGAGMSLFTLKSYVDEFRSALEGMAVPLSVTGDDTVAAVSEDIEQTTRDFVLKTLAQKLKGHPLSHFMAHLLSAMGYRTRVSPEGPDGGIDIVASTDELGFEPPVIKVQVKSGEGSVGDPVVSALCGKVEKGEFGLLVTLGTFTLQAKNFASGKANLRLVDGGELVDLILSHYEEFDSAYKGLLPLKRVYVPDAPGEDEG